MKSIVIVGAGGFAREVAWLIADINRRQTEFEFLGYVVSDTTKLTVRDSAVLGDFEWIARNRSRIHAAAIGVGTPGARVRIGEQLRRDFPEIELPPLIHPSVMIERETASIGQGVLLCAGVIGTVGVVLRDYAMLNLSCTIGHEAEIGRGAVLNPTVNVSGGVTIGDEVLIGTGSQLLQYVKIGDAAVVGAGAVVIRDVAPGVTVVGAPAKPLEKR